MMNFAEIKRYWEDRAISDPSAQSTTQDFYLREIEANVLSERIGRLAPETVADIGCGDGRTTARIASALPTTTFIGYDYSQAMVDNARAVSNSANLAFLPCDVCQGLDRSFNVIYTTRCLINLPSWELQQKALVNIRRALTSGGSYIMVENFIEGHDNFNRVRSDFGLPPIPVRNHNLFFVRKRLLDFMATEFVLQEDVNISSSYYLMSRVIYSKICAEKGISPDYFDDHHRFASGLPFCGEYGPVRLLHYKLK